MIRLFEEQVRLHPERAAIRDPLAGREASFLEVDRQARRIAAKLIREGLEPGDAVLITASRGIGYIEAMLGILMAGGAYVPLATHYPQKRVDTIREDCGANQLVVGLKCGGSDGLSGITANPAIGVFSDLLTGMGGTTILTEVPEMFGAETILMNRCGDEELFGKTVRLINDFKGYFESYHMPVYENPSPGNKSGGITTLEDKALGCTQKSGSAPVKGVLAYAEKVTAPGLNLLSAPGNDLVASTALAAAGAQLVLFSTGRGTPFGCPVPTLKIASNTPLAQKKKNWIDFNAGRLLENMTLEELGADLMETVLRTASGALARNEENGFHDLAIFKQGVTL